MNTNLKSTEIKMKQFSEEKVLLEYGELFSRGFLRHTIYNTGVHLRKF